jgi:hypothetical protein
MPRLLLDRYVVGILKGLRRDGRMTRIYASF